jgi:putative aldouronate transport system permease protein
MKIKEDRGFRTAANIVLTCLSAFAVLPFILLVIASFTDNNTAIANGYSFFPEKWSVEAYAYLAREWATIGRAYFVTFGVTIAGTALSLLVTTMLAYALAREGLPGRGIMMVYIVFTMLFNGGLVSTYFIYNNVFHIRDTIWALIVPGLLMNAFNVILVKNYFQNNIPPALVESATIDGAGELRIFVAIVMPLSLPILATVGLLTAIMYWNDWTNGLYYLTARNGAHLYSIQNLLNKMNENIAFLANNSSLIGGSVSTATLPSNIIRMAIAVIGVVPILVAYPFFQKYFVKGITIGAVKG